MDKGMSDTKKARIVFDGDKVILCCEVTRGNATKIATDEFFANGIAEKIKEKADALFAVAEKLHK